MIRTRIAPTPSGFLHKGNVFNFMLTSMLAGKGDITLRLDDIDRARIRHEYVSYIFKVIRFIDVKINGGPQLPEQLELYSQHNHINDYASLINKLRDNGHLFACTCSRSKLNEASPCDCIRKRHPFSTDVNWRLISDKKPVTFYDELSKKDIQVDLFNTMRNPVIRKKDGLPSYQLVSLADDIRMNINLIVRGEDLLESTATQIYLATLLGFEQFKATRFYHHPLLTDAEGNKLSKSAGSMSIQPYLDLKDKQKLMAEFDEWKSGFIK